MLVSVRTSAAVGNSLSAILDGKARLLFLSRNEEYIITMPYAHCKGNEATVNVTLTKLVFYPLQCISLLVTFSRWGRCARYFCFALILRVLSEQQQLVRTKRPIQTKSL